MINTTLFGITFRIYKKLGIPNITLSKINVKIFVKTAKQRYGLFIISKYTNTLEIDDSDDDHRYYKLQSIEIEKQIREEMKSGHQFKKHKQKGRGEAEAKQKVERPFEEQGQRFHPC